MGNIITVGGGKGGVGKSIVAANLAVACAQHGNRVVLADLDLGSANQHLLLGVQRPRPGVEALIDETITDPNEALTPTSVPNLYLMAGRGAVLGAANITAIEKRRLLRKLRQMDAIVIADIGAGVSFDALDFFLLGGQKVVVTTPQLTAVHDAYSFLKGVVLRVLWRNAQREIEAALIEPALLSGEAEKVANIFARLREQKPEFADKVQGVLQRLGARLIGNQAGDARQGSVFQSVSKMIRDYLGIDVPILGCLSHSSRIHESVNQRRPVMLGSANEETRMFRQMAESLLTDNARFDDLELSGTHPAMPAFGPASEPASPAR